MEQQEMIKKENVTKETFSPANKPKKPNVHASNLFEPISEDFLPGKFNPFERPSKFTKHTSYKNFPEVEERLINIKRVIKVTKGGRRFKFSALVVVGDKKGKVGFGLAKHIEVPEAIKKASRKAKNHMQMVKIVGKQDTISHELIGHFGSARVLLKPAAEGKGIVASYVVRSVVELAGIRNIYSKNLGTNNPQNVILATLDALNNLRTKEEIEALRVPFEKREIKSFKRDEDKSKNSAEKGEVGDRAASTKKDPIIKNKDKIVEDNKPKDADSKKIEVKDETK